MLSASAVLCNFSGMPKEFPASVRLGMGEEEKGAGGGSSEGRKTQVFPYITALAVCDMKLLQLRYRPDVWANNPSWYHKQRLIMKTWRKRCGKLSLAVSYKGDRLYG